MYFYMVTKCNVATWNLCLGIQNKKNIVKESIITYLVGVEYLLNVK